MNTMFQKIEYCLKYKNDIVFKFNIEKKTISMVNKDLLPISLQNKPETFGLVQKFCSDRILMLNRGYCKEILTACGIEDQSDINICIMCRALSFRDNYWISRTNKKETWENVNLYQNNFSLDISHIALTGNMQNATINNEIGDKIFTGELTGKGTRAKCYYRTDHRVIMIKNETKAEILSELITYYIAQALGIACSKYEIKNIFGKECSVCEILTCEERELIPCRDILSYYNTNQMNYKGDYYAFFMTIDPLNFIRMQILDYVTLNTDRNRDNFGILAYKGKMLGLYPLFDHDSCFKGKSTNGNYFPTGITFGKTLELLKTKYSQFYHMVPIARFKEIVFSGGFQEVFLKCKSVEEYEGMVRRMEDL